MRTHGHTFQDVPSRTSSTGFLFVHSPIINFYTMGHARNRLAKQTNHVHLRSLPSGHARDRLAKQTDNVHLRRHGRTFQLLSCGCELPCGCQCSCLAQAQGVSALAIAAAGGRFARRSEKSYLFLRIFTNDFDSLSRRLARVVRNLAQKLACISLQCVHIHLLICIIFTSSFEYSGEYPGCH